MNRPKISVIVPVYNGREYLSASLDSLLASTYENLEIILVDNGSTDGSGKICDDYAASDSRIAVLHAESNLGVSTARNMGLEIATGEWIGFFDSDDKIEPDMYEYLIYHAEAENADVAQCGVFKDYPGKTEIVNCPEKPVTVCSPNEMNEGFWQHFAFSVWSKIYKREVVRDICFRTDYIIGEDLRYNFESLIKSQKTVLLPCPKYHYLQRAGSACYSRPNEKNLTSFRKMMKDAERDFAKYDNITDFAFTEGMRNNAHVCSRIVLSREKGFEKIIREIRKDIKDNLPRIRRASALSLKDKLKLWLIAYLPKIYAFTLRCLKGSDRKEI
jgi:glycosyltransferase involved in cell wall biosynthesis